VNTEWPSSDTAAAHGSVLVVTMDVRARGTQVVGCGAVRGAMASDLSEHESD
jgi:hypothetical protein